MSLFSTISRQLAPVHREGYPFIALFALVTLILFWISTPLGWIGALATAWCAYFFRDPRRVTPVGEGLVISPADGLISQITSAVPPPELDLGNAPRQRVSIFMSVLDVHVNRSPVSGKIEKIAYKHGKFLNADLDKASEDNERNGFVIATSKGKLGVVQIAGLIARRIVCFVREGENVTAGERIGLIRFGSRVDVYLPQGTHTLVAEGQYSLGGETVLADLNASARELAFRIG
jgi:phosphatidylserine decarboxylase